MEKRIRECFEELSLIFDFPYAELKDKQVTMISHVLEGKDSFGVFPTGFGKSVVFTLVPLIIDLISEKPGHIALVCSPLRSLMYDQCASLTKMGVSAAVVTKKKLMTKEDIAGRMCNIA